MITLTTTRKIKQYRDSTGNIFEVISLYNPNEDNDTWIEYKNAKTSQTYTCRYEAFESRFSPVLE